MFLRKQFLPNISVLRTFKKFNNRGPNPGINRQNNLLEHNNKDLFDSDPELIEQVDSDFMNVHLSHKQLEKEQKIHREKLKQHIIEQKYFKVHKPNFLLYGEKEQIRLLHSREPNEWTAEKLTESFPADYETICKILKSKWTANSRKRIEKHDSKVLENWMSFKEGKFIELHPDLKQHLNKFTERNLDDLKNLENRFVEKPIKLPMPKKTEFLDIITRFEHKNENHLIESNTNNKFNNEPESINNNPGTNETYLTDEVVFKTQLRFRDLNIPSEHKNNIQNNLINNPNGTGIINSNINKNITEISTSDHEIFTASPIKEHIEIPENLWKKNGTYKIKDCYYDDDGEFLYRVPGMIK